MTKRHLRSIVILVLVLAVAAPALWWFHPWRSRKHNLANVSVLRPGDESSIAIVVWEDLACPACARVHPVIRQVAAQSNTPLIRRDFPLKSHVWTFQGAIVARFLEDTAGPVLAEQYRNDVFRQVGNIPNVAALAAFNRTWMARHELPALPSLDGNNRYATEVREDANLGNQVHVAYTPTVLVITPEAYSVIAGTGGPFDRARLERALAEAKQIVSGTCSDTHAVCNASLLQHQGWEPYSTP